MKKEVSVDEAIEKGKESVKYTPIAIFIGLFLISIILSFSRFFPVWLMSAGFIVSVLLSAVYRSMMMAKWKRWAFENVRNVHELKKRAILEKIIPDDLLSTSEKETFLEKEEIYNISNKEEYRNIETKFKQEDFFIDDPRIPSETFIFYSKSKNYIEMFKMMVVLAFGIYLIIESINLVSHLAGVVFAGIGLYAGIKHYKNAKNKDTVPKIIITDNGIQTISTEFYFWSEIKNEDVKSFRSRLSFSNYLTYEHPKGSEYLKINYYDIDRESLLKLLIFYRGRSNQNISLFR